MKVVADSSVLIALAIVDALSLLSRIFLEIIVPEGVYDEVVARGAGLPGAEEVASAAWIQRVAVNDADKTKAYRGERLGMGEAEVLALAEELKADLVLVDDERGWKVAGRKGIVYLRSTELVLEAHRRQLLDAETAEAKLVELGKKRWISEEVVEVALRQLKAQQVDGGDPLPISPQGAAPGGGPQGVRRGGYSLVHPAAGKVQRRLALDATPTTWGFIPASLALLAREHRGQVERIFYHQYVEVGYQERPYPLVPRKGLLLHDLLEEAHLGEYLTSDEG